MKNNHLVCKSITKSFGNNKIINGLDLSIKSGEVVLLLGKNGAGKSTLMKMMAGKGVSFGSAPSQQHCRPLTPSDKPPPQWRACSPPGSQHHCRPLTRADRPRPAGGAGMC